MIHLYSQVKQITNYAMQIKCVKILLSVGCARLCSTSEVILTLCIRSSTSVGSGRCTTYHHAMMRRHFFSSPLKCVERECHFFMMPHLLDIIAYCLFSCQNERASARMGERSYLCYVLYICRGVPLIFSALAKWKHQLSHLHGTK